MAGGEESLELEGVIHSSNQFKGDGSKHTIVCKYGTEEEAGNQAHSPDRTNHIKKDGIKISIGL